MFGRANWSMQPGGPRPMSVRHGTGWHASSREPTAVSSLLGLLRGSVAGALLFYA